MPFVSPKQRRFMYANHPDIAKRWTAEEQGQQAKIRAKPKKRRLNPPKVP